MLVSSIARFNTSLNKAAQPSVNTFNGDVCANKNTNQFLYKLDGIQEKPSKLNVLA